MERGNRKTLYKLNTKTSCFLLSPIWLSENMQRKVHNCWIALSQRNHSMHSESKEMENDVSRLLNFVNSMYLLAGVLYNAQSVRKWNIYIYILPLQHKNRTEWVHCASRFWGWLIQFRFSLITFFAHLLLFSLLGWMRWVPPKLNTT